MLLEGLLRSICDPVPLPPNYTINHTSDDLTSEVIPSVTKGELCGNYGETALGAWGLLNQENWGKILT